MSAIFARKHQNPEITPDAALQELCNEMRQHQEQINAQRQNQAHPPQSFNPVIAQQQHQQQQLQLQSFQGPNQFLSPAPGVQIALPGTNPSASPATISNHNTPAMQNLALQQHNSNMIGVPGPPGSVAMAHHASHQGTNPSAAGTPGTGGVSANASPNVNVPSKRRRASGVNVGTEDMADASQISTVGPGSGVASGGQLIGTGKTIKQSPRVGGKRQKGTA